MAIGELPLCCMVHGITLALPSKKNCTCGFRFCEEHLKVWKELPSEKFAILNRVADMHYAFGPDCPWVKDMYMPHKLYEPQAANED